ncbi:MAG TPA: FAD-dependent oxidoreductase [Longimicrobium sp.]|nr:FAD-dependent oxidoreductase [Longimicrobium sp.]
MPAWPFRGATLNDNREADVLVVGAGVAGLATAQAIVRRTPLNVVVVDRGTVGSGASGNSAGHLASGYEIGYSTIARAGGRQAAAHARAASLHGRLAFDNILQEWGVRCDYQDARSFVAYESPEQLSREGAADAELFPDDLRGARYFLTVQHLDRRASEFPVEVARLNAADYHGTFLSHFPAAGVREGPRTGLVDARAFCHSLANAMVQRCADRVTIYEHSPFQGFVEEDGVYRCRVRTRHIRARHLVFATNGYPPAADPHTLSCCVRPSLHCLLGFVIPPVHEPHAFGWYSSEASGELFYGNVRKWRGGRHLLVLGGPDHLEFPVSSLRATAFRAAAYRRLLDFAHATGVVPVNAHADHNWCGVLGYVKDGLRVIARDPRYANVFHNTACNGVGLLLSCYGAERVSMLIEGAPDDALFGKRSRDG